MTDAGEKRLVEAVRLRALEIEGSPIMSVSSDNTAQIAGVDRVLRSAKIPGPRDLVVLHWTIDGVSGHGSPIPYAIADAWIRVKNMQYGAGTHWAEPVDVQR